MLSVSSLLLSWVRQYLGALCESMALARIGRGKLSLCFKRNGNIVFTSKAIEPRNNGRLFGVVRDCSGFGRRPYPYAKKPVPCDF